MNGKNFKQRFISFILVVVMAMGILPLSAVNGAEFAGGDGTKENPYCVSTAEQLNAVRNNLDAYYVQTKDIDLVGFKNWVPIGVGNIYSWEKDYCTI